MTSPRDPPFARSRLPLGLGDIVRRLRRAQGWSQERLAEKVGRDRRTISRLELGRHRPTSDLVHAIERALDVAPLVPGWPEPADPAGPSHSARLRLARRTAGVTLAVAASAARVSPATLSRFEREAGGLSMMVGHPVEGMIGSDGLARALGFEDLRDLEAYCMSSDPGPWLDRIGEERRVASGQVGAV